MLPRKPLVRTRFGMAVVLLAQSACSHSAEGLLPGAGNQEGTGTGTLEVEASVAASPSRANAAANSEFVAEFSVRVSRDARAVIHGSVTITTATGKIPLTYELGRWRGTAPIYDEVYALDIASGADRVDAVRIDGPDVHTFSEPSVGQTIATNMPLIVKWNRSDQADSAALRTQLTDWIEIPDEGSYSLGPGAFKPDPTRPVMHTLQLARTNRVVPAGAAPGSTWSVTIMNQLHVNTEPTPPL
jgi:hypothetical protein